MLGQIFTVLSAKNKVMNWKEKIKKVTYFIGFLFLLKAIIQYQFAYISILIAVKVKFYHLISPSVGC